MNFFEALKILKNDDDINFITEPTLEQYITTITFTPPAEIANNDDYYFTHLFSCTVIKHDDDKLPIIHGEFLPKFYHLVSENWSVKQPGTFNDISTIEDYKSWRALEDDKLKTPKVPKLPKVPKGNIKHEDTPLEGLAKLFKELDKYTLEETDFDTAFSIITELINELKK